MSYKDKMVYDLTFLPCEPISPYNKKYEIIN